MKDYPILILPLSEEDGGGYVGLVPDLIGCMSDGETRAEAIANTEEAIAEWIDAQIERGNAVPEPGSMAKKKRHERSLLQTKIKELHERIDQFEGRFNEIEVALDDLREQLEHLDAWDRFTNITGTSTTIEQRKFFELC